MLACFFAGGILLFGGRSGDDPFETFGQDGLNEHIRPQSGRLLNLAGLAQSICLEHNISTEICVLNTEMDALKK